MKKAIKLYLSFFILLISGNVWSQAKVRDIHTATEILADVNGAEGFFEDKRIIVLSKEKNQIVAVGTIRDDEINGLPDVVKIRITEIVDNYLIMKGDSVDLVDARMYEDKKVPGFFSLTLNGSHKTPSQYKELAYFGVFTSEGHTLDQNEVLISPFQLQYGITERVGIRMVNALWLDGYANLGGKYKVFQNKHAKITVNGLGAYKVQAQDWIGQTGGVITMPQNAKFQNHLMFNITFDPQFEHAKATKDLRIFKDSDIRSITEYITDSWNRVLFGPVYNVELQTLGGTVSHMWIWETFHTSLGIATRDFTNLSFGPSAYYYVYDIFWRF